jgi:hypothetical protein
MAEQGATDHPEGPCPAAIQTAAHLYRAMTISRQGKTAEAAKFYEETCATIHALPGDENNPLVDGTSYKDLITWLAITETKALFGSPPDVNHETSKRLRRHPKRTRISRILTNRATPKIGDLHGKNIQISSALAASCGVAASRMVVATIT